MKDGYRISTDPADFDPRAVHGLLSGHAYWARTRSLETVTRSLAGSLNFGVFAGDGRLAGFSRIVSDYATFAWLCDVVVHPDHRGLGLGKALVEAVVGHPRLQGLRRIILATRDAEGLYAQYGFKRLEGPETWMAKMNN
jgi:GNAT superfamily N-acetyltransferase